MTEIDVDDDARACVRKLVFNALGDSRQTGREQLLEVVFSTLEKVTGEMLAAGEIVVEPDPLGESHRDVFRLGSAMAAE